MPINLKNITGEGATNFKVVSGVGGINAKVSSNISCLNIATNAGGGLTGFNVGGQAVAFDILSNSAIGTTYPVGSLITFQNGEVRTFVGYDDYGSVYDIFYDSPISSTTLFPITICYP